MISGSVVHGLNILVVMVSYPIYISYLGFELFSVWSLLSVVISFAMMGNLGIGRAVVTFVANAKSANDYNEINRIYHSAMMITIIPSVLIAISIWIFSPQIVRLLEVPVQHREISILVVKYIGIAIGTYLLHDMMLGILTGIGRLDISNIISLLLNIFKVLNTIVFLAIGLSLKGLIFATLSANTIFIVITFILLISKFRVPLYKWVSPTKSNYTSLLKFGSSVIGIQLLNIFSTPFIKIILARSIGIESVGIFELASKAGYALRTLFEKGLYAIMPEVASIHGLRKSKVAVDVQISAKVRSLTKRLLIYVLPSLLLFIIFAPFWLKIWLNKSYTTTLLYGFWLLQPGILVGLIALPSFYALMGTRNEIYCFVEAVQRTILLILFTGVFILFSLEELYLYFLFSLSIVISNLYIIWVFIRKFPIYNSGLIQN